MPPRLHANAPCDWWRQPVNGTHVSVVHGSPSSHVGAGPVRHPPDAGSQLSVPLHGSPSSHETKTPVQVPFRQTSPTVHALPSSHAAPFGFTGVEQPVTGSHTPAR